VAIAAAMHYNTPVTEYAPKKVKQSITGNGNADKDMVWKMLERVLNVKEKPKHYDATDALAVALCHWHQINRPVISTGKGLKGWDDFIQKNPTRLKK
jgi:crossover junction endodeoxyribonuclease RuvC